jgi:hypothetical protein
MKRASHTAVVYWLTPAPAEHELFADIIRILAEELDAPLFAPHLTLFVSPEDRKVATQGVEELEVQSFSLSIRDVQFSAAFTKTLFVRFRPSAALHHLVAEMQRRAGAPLKKISDPHLSLCYSRTLSVKSKRELASAIKLPLRKVVFNCVKLVVSRVPIRTADEVKAWQVIARKKLSD